MYEQEVVSRQRGMTIIRKTLAAGVSQQHVIDGDYIHILTAPVTDLKVRFDSGEPVPMFEGVGFRRYYRSIELESATGQTVEILCGFGSVFDGRATANVNVSATVAAGNTLRKGADVSCTSGAATLVLASDSQRLDAYITNPSTNTATVRVGPSNVDATSGIPLEPGMILPLSTTAAIYVYQASGGAVTISAASVAQV